MATIMVQASAFKGNSSAYWIQINDQEAQDLMLQLQARLLLLPQVLLRLMLKNVRSNIAALNKMCAESQSCAPP